MNIFGNYSFSRNDGFQQLDIYRRYKNADKSTNAIFEQQLYLKSRRMNNNLKIGMDYSFSKRTTLGIVISGFDNPESEVGTNTSYLRAIFP